MALPELLDNAWYRLRAKITKLTATSARIDVTLTELDGSGTPVGVVATGSIGDTDLLPDTTDNEIPNQHVYWRISCAFCEFNGDAVHSG